MKKKKHDWFNKWILMMLSDPDGGVNLLLEIEEGRFIPLYECLPQHVWRRDGRGRIDPYLGINVEQQWEAQWANAGGVAP